jgi:chemotaxis protein MotB
MSLLHDATSDAWSGYGDEGGEEDNWLISYADLLTNLLAFFVMLLSISSIHSARFEALSRAFSKTTSQLSEQKQRIDTLVTERGLADDVETVIDDTGLAIRFKTKLLFESGKAVLSKDGASVLGELAPMWRDLEGSHELIVEGHADDVPINTPAFPSNWELSSQRGVNVVKHLIALGVPRERISVRAFADTRPVDEGADSDARRALNRRVVVRVQ